MPFGSQVDTTGVRFSLWAPSAASVSLVLDGVELPMFPLPAGWFGMTLAAARPGQRYAYRIDGSLPRPDPASRFNPEDVHGPSEIIDPAAFDWQDDDWRGRPWGEAVIYELHVGTFTPDGNFSGVAGRLDYLASLGVTAIELMPVADFPGRRNWGYDGVLAFAPDASYGRPEDLKRLVQAAHERGLMVLLDVVYNHLGPEGNYLHGYAAPFFTLRHETPWGAAIDFEGPASHTVRDFFIQNALFWLEEYHLDGLRLDAVHAIFDAGSPDIVAAIATAVGRGPGRDRHIHLVLENDANQSGYLARDGAGRAVLATAQWNDDFHHALHVLLTGETEGYFADYAEEPLRHLGRCLAEGFSFQGQPSAYRGGAPRGESSVHLPPAAFVAFLQNHDQVGNRAFGERLSRLADPAALAAAVAILLLAPSPPLLFMGEEFGCTQPFLYFCDFGGEFAVAVTEGRRREFARLGGRADTAARASIPDPNAEATFLACVLDWDRLPRPPHDRWLDGYRALLRLRRERIGPLLAGMRGGRADYELPGGTALAVNWHLDGGKRLALVANLGAQATGPISFPSGEAIHLCNLADQDLHAGRLRPWSVAWFIDGGGKRP
jgi:malto-oligosyltrehalose trehalohydrolase